jgi:hypothetical protein
MEYEELETLLEKHNDLYLTERTGSQTDRFIEGLTILAKYDKNIPGAAEHDIIYLASHSDEMTEEEALRLHALGFHLEEESWCKFT